jgi:Putative Ig domain
MAFFMPTLIFGAPFNPYPVRMPVLGAYKTVIVNRPAVLSYTLPRAPQAVRYVEVVPPRSSRFRYYVYDPFMDRFGSYPVVVEGGHRFVYMTSLQAEVWLRNELIGPVEFYTLPYARRKRIWQISGRRIVPNEPTEVAVPVPNQSATIGTPYTYTIPTTTFVDPDDPGATYVWKVTKADGSPLPVQGVNFNPLTRVLSGTPTGSAGTVPLKVTVTDQFQRKVSDDFNIVFST